jgi:hypothetical protein
MDTYAKVCEGVVLNVIVADEEYFNSYVDNSPGQWVKTCIHTQANVHEEGGTPLRKNCAVIGGNYDSINDAFYSTQPYSSWTLNNETYIWEAPIDYPSDGEPYDWDEDSLNWVLVTEEET